MPTELSKELKDMIKNLYYMHEGVMYKLPNIIEGLKLEADYIESGKVDTIYMVEYTSTDMINKNNHAITFMSSNAHRTKEGCIKELEDNNFRWKQTLFGEDTNRYTKTSYGISDYAEILEFYIVD